MHLTRVALVRLTVHLVIGTACVTLAAAQSTPQFGVAPGEPQLQSMPTEPEAAPAPRSDGPGLFTALGRWVDDSIGSVTSGLNNARNAVGGLGTQANEAAQGAADAAKGAADAAASVVGVPATSVIAGHQHCRNTVNGGPDCLAAAEVLCRKKGYSGGTNLHVQSEQACPVWGWIAGDKPVGKCGTETYVTSAVCR